MSTTGTVTLNPSIIGQAEKHHTAILTLALAGTTLDEKQWITLNQLVAADAAVAGEAHVAKVAGMTQWQPADVEHALNLLVTAGLVRQTASGQVEISEAGRETVARVRAVSGGIVGRAYGSVAPEELEVAARVLVAITARMSEELAGA